MADYWSSRGFSSWKIKMMDRTFSLNFFNTNFSFFDQQHILDTVCNQGHLMVSLIELSSETQRLAAPQDICDVVEKGELIPWHWSLLVKSLLHTSSSVDCQGDLQRPQELGTSLLWVRGVCHGSDLRGTRQGVVKLCPHKVGHGDGWHSSQWHRWDQDLR